MDEAASRRGTGRARGGCSLPSLSATDRRRGVAYLPAGDENLQVEDLKVATNDGRRFGDGSTMTI